MTVEATGFDLEEDERRGLVALPIPGAYRERRGRRCTRRTSLGRRLPPRRLPNPALSPRVPRPPIPGLELAGAVSRPRPPTTPALDRFTTDERGQLLGELLVAHPELAAEAERLAVARLATVDADEVAEDIEWTLREADAETSSQKPDARSTFPTGTPLARTARTNPINHPRCLRSELLVGCDRCYSDLAGGA